MQKRDKRIDDQVRTTLEILDNLPQLKAHHLFRVHLMNRIEQNSPGMLHMPYMAGYGLKMALMALLVVINIGTAFLFMQSGNDSAMISENDMLERLNNEYSSPALSYYLDETQEDAALE